MNDKGIHLLEAALLPLSRGMRRRWLNVFLIALLIAAILISLAAVKLPQKLPAVSLCVAVLLVVVLVHVRLTYVRATYEYVKIRQEQLALLRGQVKRDRKVKFAFTLRCDNEKAFFCVANLGRTPIMLERCRVSNGQQQFTRDAQEWLPKGREVLVDITDVLAEAQTYLGDVEIAFDYLSAGRYAISGWHGFNLLNDEGRIRRVRPGMHEPQMVYCPICEWGVLMTTEGLSRLHEKAERVARTSDQIGRSCPDHNFDWPYGSISNGNCD